MTLFLHNMFLKQSILIKYISTCITVTWLLPLNWRGDSPLSQWCRLESALLPSSGNNINNKPVQSASLETVVRIFGLVSSPGKIYHLRTRHRCWAKILAVMAVTPFAVKWQKVVTSISLDHPNPFPIQNVLISLQHLLLADNGLVIIFTEYYAKTYQKSLIQCLPGFLRFVQKCKFDHIILLEIGKSIKPHLGIL